MSAETEPPENDEQGDEQAEWRKATGLELDLSKSVSDMTNAELRAKIAQRTGHRPPRHAVTKPMLNSLHAWFTAEYFVKPARLRPGVPPKRELLEQVVLDAVAAYENHPTDPDEDDRDDHPADALLDYLDDVKDTPDTQTARAMNKDELRQFVAAMDTSGDQRAWTGGDDEE